MYLPPSDRHVITIIYVKPFLFDLGGDFLNLKCNGMFNLIFFSNNECVSSTQKEQRRKNEFRRKISAHGKRKTL